MGGIGSAVLILQGTGFFTTYIIKINLQRHTKTHVW